MYYYKQNDFKLLCNLFAKLTINKLHKLQSRSRLINNGLTMNGALPHTLE